MPEASEQADAFEVFEEISEIFGYVWKSCGRSGLRQLLRSGKADFYRQTLEKAASELSDVGLTEAASIVGRAAADAPPKPWKNWWERQRARQNSPQRV